MATSRYCDANQLVYDHSQRRPIASKIPPPPTDITMENRVLGTGRAKTRAAAPHDPFTFYKTCLNSNMPILGEHDFRSSDDGYTCRSGAATNPDGSPDDAQPQARGHTAAYKLAVRLANCSNGAPLATIIEQGSYSTLNSHGSLLCMGRFPSMKAAENTSLAGGSRRRSHSLDERVLHDIQEDLARESDASAVAVPHARLNEESEAADPTSSTATPLTSYRFELQQSPASLSGNELLDHEHRGVKGFMRGVLQNVRGVSRTRSRTSSMTHAPIVDHRESPPSTCESSPQVDLHVQGPDRVHLRMDSCGSSTRVPDGVAIAPTLGHQTRNRAISSLGADFSAHMRLPSVKPRSDIFESPTVFGSIPPALTFQTATRSHDRPFSTPVVHAGTRDVARNSGAIPASTSQNDMFDTTAQCPIDGVPVYREHSSSREASSVKESFTIQNASFCSTMTSSYSGTVLGIDLDLQHDFSRPIRRSQSPPTPVWFTPQMAEQEQQAAALEPFESVKVFPPGHAPSRSIKSSALTSLLPIAAASSIVRPNYKTPKISFYSPSGNLIQPESSSSQGISPSDHGGSPTITSYYYNRQHCDPGSSAGGSSIRPPSVPITTLPVNKTPLSSHLRHHHNYRRPEISKINPCESSVTPRGPLKGCDGMVRENSPTSRSGVFFPHGKDKAHHPVKLAVHDLKAEAKFYKARFITLAAAHSFALSMPKGRTLQKRQMHNHNTYAMKPRVHDGDHRKGSYRQDVFAPLAAHALRVCFCQPYDGAGMPTRATAAGACMAGESSPTSGKPKVDLATKDVDNSLPNARVLDGRRRSEGGYTKRPSRDGAVDSATRRTPYTSAEKRKIDYGGEVEVPYLGTTPRCSCNAEGHAALQCDRSASPIN